LCLFNPQVTHDFISGSLLPDADHLAQALPRY